MSSDGERSPKRQRLDSYSPASPPPVPSDTKAFLPPHTPPPSVRMSPSWQSQQQQQQQSVTTGAFPTPPSTSGFHGTAAGHGSDPEAHERRLSNPQSPSSDTEKNQAHDGERDEDAEMTDLRQASVSADVAMADAGHRRTDHEREAIVTGPSTSSLPPAHSLYKVSTIPIAPSRPHPSQDIIQLYGLQRIQASVARRNPVTGEKINKLRKSYENKVKALGLEGRNKAQANQGELQGLVDPLWSSDVGGMTMWDAKVQGDGKDLFSKDTQHDLFSKLSSAVQMQPGRLPAKEHREWQNMLGLEDSTMSGAKAPPPGQPSPLPSAMARTAPAAASRSSAPASPRSLTGRPERTNKKRRYDDSSYEGYSQGYDEDGYSTGGMDDTGRRRDGAKRQKRKDVTPGHSSPAFSTNPAGSSNMVGVRTS